MKTLVRAIADGVRPQAAGPTASRSGGSMRGSIPLIGSRGIARAGTYRLIYLTNPWIYAAVNKLAKDGSRLPLHFLELDAEGMPERVRGDLPTNPGRRLAGQQLDRIMQQPDPRKSQVAMWRGTWVDRLVSGNALWEVLRPGGGGAPNGFRRIAWRDVQRVLDDVQGDPILYDVAHRSWDGFGSSRPRQLSPDEVVHFGRGLDPDGSVNVSPLEACRYTIALYEGVVRHLVAYFANQARPSGVVSVENLSRETADLIRELIEEAYTSPENAGKVLVTSGKWDSASDTPEVSRVVELIRLSREEAVTVYGVPPPSVGILEQAIKSNVAELREQYGRDGLGPIVAEFESEIKAQVCSLAPGWRDLIPRFELAEVLRPDPEALAKVLKDEMDVATTDERRKFLGLPPLQIKGVTDQPWVASGALPLEKAAAAKPATAGFSVADDEPEEEPEPDEDEED